MRKKWFKISIIFASLAVVLTSCYEDPPLFSDDVEEAITNILQTDAYKDDYSKFMELMDIANVTNTLKAYEPWGRKYTLFVPHNDAFDAFVAEAGYASFEDMKQDTFFVRELVRYHVVMRSIRSFDFTYGALSDTTATGDYLTIGFGDGSTSDSVIYRLNGIANITFRDVEASNGYIHGLDNVLPPNVYTIQQWLDRNGGENSDFSIFYKALIETGVYDLLTPTYTIADRIFERDITLWIESDDVFNQNGIYSFEDLVSEISTTEDITNPENDLYKFMAYHVMNGSYYLNDLLFEDRVQNGEDPSGIFETFADQIISIRNDNEIKINMGGQPNDTIFIGNDTIPVNYISPLLDKSNFATRNGPVHFISDLLEIERFGAQTWRTDFLEEPLFSDIRPWSGFYSLEVDDYDVLTRFTIAGIPYFEVRVENVGIWDEDRFIFDGDFTVEYETNKLLPGRYKLSARFFRNLGSRAATVQFYLDDKRLGAPYDCSNFQQGSQPATIELGIVDFAEYETHTIKFDAVKAGRFEIFWMEFNTNLD